jgi:large subunit ribosomal protein L21
MYAIVKSGGKQLKVAPGQRVQVEKLLGDVGSSVTLTNVLLVANGSTLTVGAPLVAGASVTAKIVEHFKGEKVIIFKKRRRQNSRRKNGHRQLITTLEITGIKAGK